MSVKERPDMYRQSITNSRPEPTARGGWLWRRKDPLSQPFSASKHKNQASTVAILAQGTSWAVAVTQAFLTWVRFPLGACSWAPGEFGFSQRLKVSDCSIRALCFILIPVASRSSYVTKASSRHQKRKTVFEKLLE